MSVELSANCPDCGNVIPFKIAPRMNQTVVCANCEAALVVIALNPIELDWAFEDEVYDEEFDDFDFDEEYEEDLDDYEETFDDD